MKASLQGILLVLFISLLAPGCASIFGSSRFPVSISSTPYGANYIVTNRKGDTVFHGKTPATIVLKSYGGYFQKQSYLLKFNEEGFAEKTYPVEFRINGFYFANILIGGALGMLIIDPLTGCMWTLPASLRDINATLEPLKAVNTPSLKIINLNDLDPELKKQLIPIQVSE
jgi:hypothetical protein